MAIAFSTFVTALPAVAGVLTLSWTGGYWNDGGSLSGTFTVDYASNGMPTNLVSADVITGNGTSDGFIGQSYIYNVSGLTSTVDSNAFYFDATQFGGNPANELEMTNANGYRIFLDWLGTNPTGLWVGHVGGQYSSENDPDYTVIRYLNSSEGGGSSGTGSDTPEPASFVLAGLGLAGVCLFRHRKT